MAGAFTRFDVVEPHLGGRVPRLLRIVGGRFQEPRLRGVPPCVQIALVQGHLPVNIALIKGFSVMGVRAGEYGRQFPEKGRENQAAIWDLAAKMKPRVDQEHPLSEWRAAFDSLADRKVVGKTIVRPDL